MSNPAGGKSAGGKSGARRWSLGPILIVAASIATVLVLFFGDNLVGRLVSAGETSVGPTESSVVPSSVSAERTPTADQTPTAEQTPMSEPTPTTKPSPSAEPSATTEVSASEPPVRKTYYPKPNISRYSSTEYLIVKKALVDREANLVTVYFESHGDLYPLDACIRHSSYGNIHIKNENYEIARDKYQKGTLEFQLQGAGIYTYNNGCNEEYTDVRLFKL